MKKLKILIMLILLMSLIISCQTPAVKVEVQSVIIPIPLPPVKPGIQFSDTGDGLFLSYEDGRKLNVYLIEIETYEKKLLKIIDYVKNLDKEVDLITK